MLRVWTERLGQKHYVRDGMHETICGMSLLDNNYANIIAESEQKECEKCAKILEKN